jgi:hypothetical protein
MKLNSIFTELLNQSISDIRETPIYSKYFSSTELEQIDDRYYLTNLSQGIGFLFNEELYLKTVHLYSEKKDSASSFMDELPEGLSFSDDINSIEEKIKDESFESGGGTTVPFFGKSNIWRKY